MNTKVARNKQYYGFNDIQKDLYKNSKSGKRNFNKLFEMIISDENILLAYRLIKSNTGSKTKGTDDWNIMNVAELDKETFINKIRSTLVNYKPQSVRRVMIDKPNGGKRPLGIPCILDRIIQQMFLNVLEPICEAKFYNHSYGFRPLRSTRHAIARVQTLVNINKLHYTVDIDVKAFFDNVNHNLLIKQLWNIGIRDKRVLAIIGKMLKTPIKGIGILNKGVPQGGILSPLLSNVVLNDLDQWVADQFDTLQKTRKSFKSNDKKIAELRHKSCLKQGYIVRYADDFRIMAKSYNIALRWFHAVRLYLKDRLKLDISKEKSKVINLKRHSSTFLGYEIKAIVKKTKVVAITRMSPKKKQDVIKTIRERIILISREQSMKNIMNYNSAVLGIQQYFQYATHVVKDFADIEYRLIRTLRSKLISFSTYGKPKGLEDKSAYKKFYTGNRKTYKIGGIYLYPIGEIKTKNNMNFSQSQNPYDCNITYSWDIELTKLMRSNIQGRSVEYMDNRLSSYSMQKGKCAITGQFLTADKVHCHHKTPVTLGGSDTFKNLVIVHKDVHILIHATKEETIHKYKSILGLNSMQLRKINQLRGLCKLEII
ncbi:group II intron reverse transcriptase/maturase [Bacillus thuringiensis]|uniref:Group II intron reverse transcriptase/maturase n=1 Tax=Bacillus thuringiensis TaxID=1428 RepID=A0A9W3TIX6_BACTU|nr:group II intron reverse transcriptase/maturase [Bacillus thuringiensis]AQY38559.1 group II intron reverse transcriptase/maturase [Bacillus thuringiensis]AQY42419.1 group II intron reverse transcriptase/maturase [Bacillus thuringiensis]MDR4150857.1 group II intron reverse transcriptase/maturase [Bacillus thuringiensis]MEC3575698.1 group II intron reverse transcriptase/maturase [Bacillus thuringiensis]MED2022520.1 group II intron reverse transcriptase/maturase [Bacillus thuringiensis]